MDVVGGGDLVRQYILDGSVIGPTGASLLLKV